MAEVIRVLKNEATAARRRAYFYCVDATDGMTPETGEAGGQPQISVDGGAFTNTGIGTLTAAGNGDYYADVTQATTNVNYATIRTRYKSANTAECRGSTLLVSVNWDRVDAAVSTVATPAQVAAALNTYDAPTKAELDSGFAGLADVDDIWSAATSGTAFTVPGGVGKMLLLLRKLLFNKSVDSGTSIEHFDDNGTTSLGTSAWTDVSGTRGKHTVTW
jgi:hypothetical protein